MQYKFTFKHLEALKSIEDYAMTRVEKIAKYSLHKEPKVHFIFSVQRLDQVAEIIVDAGPVHYTSHAKDSVLYAAIDKAVDKLERQLVRHKERVKDHHHNESLGEKLEELTADAAAYETFSEAEFAEKKFKKAD